MWTKNIEVQKSNGAQKGQSDKKTRASAATVAALMDRFERFVKAQQRAELAKSSQFTCPLCGGKATWKRSLVNKRLSCKCANCEFGFQA